MTRYFFDTEFLEDGKTIELISIGIVAQDGREYYGVNDDATKGRWWFSRFFGKALNYRIRSDQWLMDNVVPGLPSPKGALTLTMPGSWIFNYLHRDVKKPERIANEVRAFLLAGESKPELWANYSAYDHVRLAQLWGRMIDLPPGIPMTTFDVVQLAHHKGIPLDDVPKQQHGEHDALADARHTRDLHDFLAAKPWPASRIWKEMGPANA